MICWYVETKKRSKLTEQNKSQRYTEQMGGHQWGRVGGRLQSETDGYETYCGDALVVYRNVKLQGPCDTNISPFYLKKGF